MSRTKRIECLFHPKNASSQFPFSFLNGDALSCEHTVKYRDGHFSSNITWSTHTDTVFTKCIKVKRFFIRRLRSMNVTKSLLWRIVSACTTHVLLYFSPIISPDCLTKNVAFSQTCELLISLHCFNVNKCLPYYQ